MQTRHQCSRDLSLVINYMLTMTQLLHRTLVTCLIALNKTTHWRLLRIWCPRTVFMMTSDHVAFASRVSRFTACSSAGAWRPRRPSRYPSPQPANSTPTNARPSHTRDFMPGEPKNILKFSANGRFSTINWRTNRSTPAKRGSL